MQVKDGWVQVDKFCMHYKNKWMIDKNCVMEKFIYVLWNGLKIVGTYKSCALAKKHHADLLNKGKLK